MSTKFPHGCLPYILSVIKKQYDIYCTGWLSYKHFESTFMILKNCMETQNLSFGFSIVLQYLVFQGRSKNVWNTNFTFILVFYMNVLDLGSRSSIQMGNFEWKHNSGADSNHVSRGRNNDMGRSDIMKSMYTWNYTSHGASLIWTFTHQLCHTYI